MICVIKFQIECSNWKANKRKTLPVEEGRALLNGYEDTHWSENSFDFQAKAFVFKRLKETYGKRNHFISFRSEYFQRFSKENIVKSIFYIRLAYRHGKNCMASKSVQWAVEHIQKSQTTRYKAKEGKIKDKLIWEYARSHILFAQTHNFLQFSLNGIWG